MRGSCRSSGQTRRADILYDSARRRRTCGCTSRRSSRRASARRTPIRRGPTRSGSGTKRRTRRVPVADSIRYYFNSLPTNETAWVEPRKFDALARPSSSSPIGSRSRCSSTARSRGRDALTGVPDQRRPRADARMPGSGRTATAAHGWLAPARKSTPKCGRVRDVRRAVVRRRPVTGPRRRDRGAVLGGARRRVAPRLPREVLCGRHRSRSTGTRCCSTCDCRARAVERNRLFTEAASRPRPTSTSSARSPGTATRGCGCTCTTPGGGRTSGACRSGSSRVTRRSSSTWR
jgi:hypothetical protein